MKTLKDYLETIKDQKPKKFKKKTVADNIISAFDGEEVDKEMETFELDPEPINPNKKKIINILDKYK